MVVGRSVDRPPSSINVLGRSVDRPSSSIDVVVGRSVGRSVDCSPSSIDVVVLLSSSLIVEVGPSSSLIVMLGPSSSSSVDEELTLDVVWELEDVISAIADEDELADDVVVVVVIVGTVVGTDWVLEVVGVSITGTDTDPEAEVVLAGPAMLEVELGVATPEEEGVALSFPLIRIKAHKLVSVEGLGTCVSRLE